MTVRFHDKKHVLTWYVLSKLSYMNLVIIDVFPTTIKQPIILNKQSSNKKNQSAISHKTHGNTQIADDLRLTI